MKPIVALAGVAGSGKGEAARILREEFSFTEICLADPGKRHCMELFDFSKDQLWGPSESRNKPDTRYPRQHGPIVRVTLEADPSKVVFACRCCGREFEYTGTDTNVCGEYLVQSQENIPKCFLTPRYALQTLCGDWARGCYTDINAYRCIRTAKALATDVNIGYAHHTGLTTSSTGGRQGVVISDVRMPNELEMIKAEKGKVILITGRDSSISGAQAQHVSEVPFDNGKDFYAVFKNKGTLEEFQSTFRDFVEDALV